MLEIVVILSTLTPGAVPKKSDSLHINFNKKNASGSFTMHIFKDHDHMIAFIPSLNLTAYGDNGNQAANRLIKEVLDDCLKTLITAGPDIAAKELKKLGWKRNNIFKKRFVSEAYV